jgi:hypothetical protein
MGSTFSAPQAPPATSPGGATSLGYIPAAGTIRSPIPSIFDRAATASSVVNPATLYTSTDPNQLPASGTPSPEASDAESDDDNYGAEYNPVQLQPYQIPSSVIDSNTYNSAVNDGSPNDAQAAAAPQSPPSLIQPMPMMMQMPQNSSRMGSFALFCMMIIILFVVIVLYGHIYDMQQYMMHRSAYDAYHRDDFDNRPSEPYKTHTVEDNYQPIDKK